MTSPWKANTAVDPAGARFRRTPRWWERAVYYVSVPITWLRLTLHNTWGILNVLDFIWLRPLPGGLIDERHPFCTGLNPLTGASIWTENIVFRSPRKPRWRGGVSPASDEEMVNQVGDYLRRQVWLAASTADYPQGRPSRMPPGILYLHGGVHYHGGWLLFNDFPDAIRHFTDPRFLAEFKRFVREQRREPITLFRERDYDRLEFGRFVCFMRTVLPWFSNSNGPKKWVLWGNPAPYPAVNTITGHWIGDCRALKKESSRRQVARPPIPPDRYFQSGPYFGSRDSIRWPERLLALFTDYRIRFRGRRENLYFVDKRKIQRGFRFGPDPILNPWRRFCRWLGSTGAGRVCSRVFRCAVAGMLLVLPAGSALAWGPHPVITQTAMDALGPGHPLREALGSHWGNLTNLCWLPDHKRTPFPDGDLHVYADDYLLFPGVTEHLDHICPEVRRAYRPYFRRALQALRTEDAANAARWIGSLLHFTEDTGSPPHAAEIRGGTHIKMENWVDASRIRLPDYEPQRLGDSELEAEDGFVRRMEGLIEFSKPRGQRLVSQVLLGRRGAVEPAVLECALETARVTADVLHTLGHLIGTAPAYANGIRGRVPGQPPSELATCPAKIMLLGTAYSTVSDRDGRFEFRHLPPGRYQLLALRPGCGSAQTDFELPPDAIYEVDLSAMKADVNYLRNGSFESHWLDPDRPDFWHRTGAGWEGEIVPLRIGQRYRLEVRFHAAHQTGADVLVRWSRRIAAEVPRVSPLPRIESKPITADDPVLEFEGSDHMELMHVTLRTQSRREPAAICQSIRLIPL